jgi:hypothetical protein
VKRKLMKLLTVRYSAASHHIAPLRSKYSPLLPVHKCSSVGMKDQVAHPYRALGGVVVLFFGKEKVRQNILNRMVANIP